MRFRAIIKNEGFKLTQGMAVMPDDIFVQLQNEIHTGRRDWASFAVIISSDHDALLSVTPSTAFTPRARHETVRMSASCPGIGDMKINFIGMVDDDDGMYKADILLEGDSFHLAAFRAHQLRVSVDIPKDAAIGTHSGTISFHGHRMFGDEVRLCSLDFTIHVHDVLLPEIKERVFHLDLWQHLSNISRKHEVKLFSDEHFQIVERYVETLANLGQKSISIIASEIPWSGQRCFLDRDYMSDMFEYNMVRATRDLNGRFQYDYSNMERYIDLCFRHGIDREIEIFGLVNIWLSEDEGYGKAVPDWPDGIRIRYYDEVTGTYAYMHESEELIDYIKALQSFFIGKGWIDKVLVMADEPADIERFRLSLDAIRRAAPEFRFKTCIADFAFIDEFKEVISDFAPILFAVSKEWHLFEGLRKEISGKLHYYVCCHPPYPNNYIRSPLAEGRLIPILASFMHMDGFLRWDYTAWPENPRERLAYRTGEWWSGDTCFVYPSKGGYPLLSLRYYSLKRGIEDFELISMLRNRPGGDNAIMNSWSQVIFEKDMKKWTFETTSSPSSFYSMDWTNYEKARCILLTALETSHRVPDRISKDQRQPMDAGDES